MAPNRKDFADYLRLGLRVGICDLALVSRWAEQIVVSDPSPPFAFFDLAISESQPINSILSLLADVPGDPTQDLAVHMLLGQCCRLTRAEEISRTDILLRLYRMAEAEDFPDAIRSALCGLEDDFSLARDGVYDTISDVESAVAEFLARFEQYAPS